MKPAGSVALITPSYRGDFERCKLLCASVDRFLTSACDHYILVDDDDFSLFASLANAKRHIVNEQDILPGWLHSFRPPFGANARKLWVSLKTWPMRGWHVQQLRRIAIASHVEAEALLYCDSDMLFVREFAPESLWKSSGLRLYRNKFGIDGELAEQGAKHRQWTKQAASLNGLPAPDFPADDYINNLVSWRRDHILAMCSHIEVTTGKDWLSAIASSRTFSECQIYGAYADGVCKGQGHWHTGSSLCRTYWSGEALNESGLKELLTDLESEQVAIGIQSFTGTDPTLLRRLIDR
ncbi:MAG: DUF6492 family protein [Rhizobiaceae bacterium]